MASDAEGQCLLPRTARQCQRSHYQRLLTPREGGRTGGSQDPRRQGAAGTGCRQAAVPTSLSLEDGQGAWGMAAAANPSTEDAAQIPSWGSLIS